MSRPAFQATTTDSDDDELLAIGAAAAFFKDSADYVCAARFADGLLLYGDRETVMKAVEEDLRRAERIVSEIPDSSLGESRDIWTARISGQRAILAERVYQAGFASPKRPCEDNVESGHGSVYAK